MIQRHELYIDDYEDDCGFDVSSIESTEDALGDWCEAADVATLEDDYEQLLGEHIYICEEFADAENLTCLLTQDAVLLNQRFKDLITTGATLAVGLHAAQAEIERLNAKVERLTARGIEDMQDENERLNAEVSELQSACTEASDE